MCLVHFSLTQAWRAEQHHHLHKSHYECGAIVQDFALEADESRMRNGAHLMAGSLSGSLALVTGREPLRHSLTSQLRLMLANMLDPPTLESTIAVSLLHGTPTSRTRHGPSCCKGGSQ